VAGTINTLSFVGLVEMLIRDNGRTVKV